MNEQRNKSTKKQVNIKTMFYQITEVNSSICIAVLIYISIVVLNCCHTVVWECRFIPAKRQRIKVTNHYLGGDLKLFINNYLLI